MMIIIITIIIMKTMTITTYLLQVIGFDRVMYLNHMPLARSNESAKAIIIRSSDTDQQQQQQQQQCNPGRRVRLRELGPHALHEAVQCADHRHNGQF